MSTNQYTFVPANALIIAATNSHQSTFTFSAPHTFSVGEIVSFRSSKPYGMFEINNLRGLILSLTQSTITTNLDTSLFNSFVYPPIGTPQYLAMAVPSSSGQIKGSFPVGNILEDAFDNVPTN